MPCYATNSRATTYKRTTQTDLMKPTVYLRKLFMICAFSPFLVHLVQPRPNNSSIVCHQRLQLSIFQSTSNLPLVRSGAFDMEYITADPSSVGYRELPGLRRVGREILGRAP